MAHAGRLGRRRLVRWPRRSAGTRRRRRPKCCAAAGRGRRRAPPARARAAWPSPGAALSAPWQSRSRARSSSGRAARSPVAGAASSRPVVLVLDDLHVCPPGTRALVGAALAPVPPPGVLLIGCAARRLRRCGRCQRLPGVDAARGGRARRPARRRISPRWRRGRRVPAVLAPTSSRCCTSRPAGARWLSLEVLARLDTAAAPSLEAAIAATCPYRGRCRWRSADDADVFFGREEVVAALLGRLGQHARLLAVVGASGSGKSSVLRRRAPARDPRRCTAGERALAGRGATPGPRPAGGARSPRSPPSARRPRVRCWPL